MAIGAAAAAAATAAATIDSGDLSSDVRTMIVGAAWAMRRVLRLAIHSSENVQIMENELFMRLRTSVRVK
eukprot:CAMPEP_0113573016 /NCGR_PEP_ID=MMETSP0015_2-20120614/26393_1 /TAXON_ID=2838 /ORGANISM="Odontella" /LENGTH=69 /DNA_ID=CAMNT_0000476067 /DNA_START=44 /DNA_END=253 /DNA_ORIENTATION=- /assembly_acc=CAM_ASM_000160